MPPLLLLPEPPTDISLRHARQSLAASESQLQDLQTKIEKAEDALRKYVTEARCAIDQMQSDFSELQDAISQTRAYLAPIKRLPPDLLRSVFLCLFDEYCTCGWVLSAVCSTWRREALKTPRLWSRVCSCPSYGSLDNKCYLFLFLRV
jgi:hypothetical protein